MKISNLVKGGFFVTFFISCVYCHCPQLLAEENAFPVEVPLGLYTDYMIIPEENPLTKEKADLGKLLYFDARLSRDGTVSCATCHHPQKGWTDQAPVSTGIENQKGSVSAPTVLNSGFMYIQFWDGRAKNLEEQAKGPIENPIEMGNTHEQAVKTIAGIDGYKPYFQKAFQSEEVSIDRIARAIASFERTVLSGNSAWDRFTINKDETALSASAKRGLALFEGKARCTECHVGATLSDSSFHNIGVGMNTDSPDWGRFKVTGKEKDRGAFKTPTLRDLLRTSPYMHDGSVATLEEVVEFYNKGGEVNPWLDSKMQPLNLTSSEETDLVEFLKNLEGDWTPVEEPQLP